MRSALDRSILRQQYRFSPNSSKVFAGSSPLAMRFLNSSQAEATTRPHVKHRIGMIIDSHL